MVCLLRTKGTSVINYVFDPLKYSSLRFLSSLQKLIEHSIL